MIDLTFDGAVSNGLVAEICLNNPAKLNVVDEAALAELAEALQTAQDAGARALVVRGEGRGFCAGRDIAQVDAQTDDAAHYLDEVVAPVLRQLAQFPAPVYGAGQGAILGVGLGLLIACDVVYVADDAKVGSPFGNLGAVLDSGGHSLFYERLGYHRAMDLVYSGELMTGAEAVAAGLFSRSLPAGELLEFTRMMAGRAATGPTAAFVASKRLMAGLRERPVGLWDAMAAEAQSQGAVSVTHDYQEGFTAFKAKRRPEFTGV
jgi:enoyl-CoA hydratase/carnithine racemase